MFAPKTYFCCELWQLENECTVPVALYAHQWMGLSREVREINIQNVQIQFEFPDKSFELFDED
jgi:hypothetical protein